MISKHPGTAEQTSAWSAQENRSFAARHMQPLFANDEIFSQTREHGLVVIQPGHRKILFRNRERSDGQKQPSADQNDAVSPLT